jgi:uncharacterized protein
MFLNTQQVTSEPVPFDHQIELSKESTRDSPLHAARDIRLVGQAWRAERGVTLEARLTATISMDCGRCVEPFESALSEDFKLTIVPGTEELGGGEIEVAEEDMDLYYAESGKADFQDIASEQLYLNLPMCAVCQPDCQGLCPTCGVNRNRIECGCQSQDLDPRLAPLLDLKLDFKKKLDDR